MALLVRIITPKGLIWQGQALELILPGSTGRFGILPNHAPLLTLLSVGIIRLRTQTKWLSIAIAEGLAEVEDNQVTILTSAAEQRDGNV